MPNYIDRFYDDVADEAVDIRDTHIREALTDEFDVTKNYAIGEYTIYDGEQYKFIAAHAAGAWNPAHVMKAQVCDALQEHAERLTDVEDDLDDLEKDGESIPGTDVSPYIIRKTDSAAVDHPYKREKLIGGTVAWNQLQQNGNFSSGTEGWARDKCTVSASNNEVTITTNNDAINGSIYKDIVTVPGHKYVVICQAKVVDSSATAMLIAQTGTNIGANTTSTSFENLAFIFTTIQSSIRILDRSSGSGMRCTFKNNMVFDLTQMFGSEIADYIYGLEQATAGAGVAFFRSMFPADYYPYNAGQLMSVKSTAHLTTGKNLVEKTIKEVSIDASGQIGSNSNFDLHVAKIIKGLTYTIKADGYVYGIFTSEPYSASQAYDKTRTIDTETFVAPINGYVAFRTSAGYATPQLEIGSVSTAYEPYSEETYTLDPNIELRGIPQLVNNKLAYDGDEYEADGKVKRKYGVVDLGTLTWNSGYDGFYASNGFGAKLAPNLDSIVNAISQKYVTTSYNNCNDKCLCGWTGGNCILIKDSAYTDAATFKAAMSGVYLVYELASETEEQALPFYSAMKCDSAGIEEWIDERAVQIPVGHETLYLGQSVGEGAYSGAGWKQGDEVIRRNTAELLGYREDTDVATHNITAGQYVVWKDGLYTAKSNISTGTALSSTNLQVANKGGFNSILDSVLHTGISYSIGPGESITLYGDGSGGNRLPSAYILVSRATFASSLGFYVGVGYGEDALRHKIQSIIEAGDLTVAPTSGSYGITVTNSNLSNSLRIFIFSLVQ